MQSDIEQHDVSGVVFASGDLHLGYLMHQQGHQLASGKVGPDYWEVASSPLAQEIWKVRVQVGTQQPTFDPLLVAEVTKCNYGLLDVDLDRSGAELQLNLRDEQGGTIVARPVALGALRVRAAPRPKLSAVVWPNGYAYFFRGKRYVRYVVDPAHEGVDSGYPKPIMGNWPGLAEAFPEGVDAVAVWPGSSKARFFKGNGYVRYTVDPAHERVDDGYPRYVLGDWSGLAGHFPDGVDAVVVWPTNGKAYFFKGKSYVRYTWDATYDSVDPEYPKPILGNWPGLAEVFPDGIDAVVVWPTNDKAYFFKGGSYVRYTVDPAHEGVDPDYPKPIAGNWPGLEAL